MEGEFRTTEEGVVRSSGTPETRPLHKPGARNRARPEVVTEEMPASELPKELVEVIHTIGKALDQIRYWEKVVEELRGELDQLKASGKIKILTSDIFILGGPVPFLLDKLMNLSTKLKGAPYEPPVYELSLLEGSEKYVGQLEILKLETKAREEELARLKEAAGVARENILEDLERGGSSPSRKNLVARLLSDFQALTSQRIFELLAVRIELEKKILRDSESAVNAIKHHFSIA